jgi:hypothetical protein
MNAIVGTTTKNLNYQHNFILAVYAGRLGLMQSSHDLKIICWQICQFVLYWRRKMLHDMCIVQPISFRQKSREF